MKTILTQISLRAYGEKDYEFIHELSRANMKDFVDRHWGGWSEKLFKKDLKTENIRIMRYADRDVALVETEMAGRYLRLRNIQVWEEFQGKGLGSFFMGLVEREARECGAKSIKLTVFVDNPALGFYERRGFVISRRDIGTIGMEKVLDRVENAANISGSSNH